jgi:hypothetical protein
MLENTEGIMKGDNPEKLATQFLWIVPFHYPFGILQHLFVLCLLYPMLPVSLDCPFSLPLGYSLTFICPVSCVPYVANFSGLSYFITFLYSLTCICPVSCAPYAACFSGLSFFENTEGAIKKYNPEKLVT